MSDQETVSAERNQALIEFDATDRSAVLEALSGLSVRVITMVATHETGQLAEVIPIRPVMEEMFSMHAGSTPEEKIAVIEPRHLAEFGQKTRSPKSTQATLVINNLLRQSQQQDPNFYYDVAGHAVGIRLDRLDTLIRDRERKSPTYYWFGAGGQKFLKDYQAALTAFQAARDEQSAP